MAGPYGQPQAWPLNRQHVDQMFWAKLTASQLEAELVGYLNDEVTRNGRLAGRTGFYELTPIVGFMPTTEHLGQREAFLRAPNDIGHDRECADREIFVSNAVAGGRLLLRACVVNFRTTSADAEAIPGIVLRHAEGLAQARRPAP